MHKGWNSAKDYKEAIRKIHDAGINVIGSFVFGLDEDDKTVFQDTLDFVMEADRRGAVPYINPLPGTVTYGVLDKEGRIIDGDWGKYHTGEVVFQPRHMSVDELQKGLLLDIQEHLYLWEHLKAQLLGAGKG